MPRPHPWRKFAPGLLLCGGLFGPCVLTASAQSTQPAPPAPSLPAAPSIPAAPAAPVVAPATTNDDIAEAATSREAVLEDRIQRLETIIQQMQAGGGNAATGPISGPNALTGTVGRDDPNTPRTFSDRPNATYPRSSGAIAPGQGTPAVPPPSDKNNMPAKAFDFPLKGRFGPGFEFRTGDDEYVLQFHNLTQVDFRGYQQGGQNPVHDTFAIPRQWFMFSGRLTKPFEYFVSFQNGFDTVSGLDIFGNIHYDDRLQFKFGRYKTPFTYEFYALPIQGLIQPERSLFFNNTALNREIGLTAWGQLFEKRIDWATAILNQARNGFLDTNDGKDFAAFVNFRPFWKDEGNFFQFLNFGGSVLTGDGINPVTPQTYRTVVPTAGNSVFGVPFLTWNNNAREAGLHTFYDLHLALYRKQLSVVGEWQSGTQQYALSTNIAQRTRIPTDSFYVQAGYFLTGETVTGRNVVNPIKPFDPRPEHFGLGAFEVTGRYNYFVLGPQVFTGGFADANQWTRSLYTTNVGFNWYWSQNIKWMFTWEHAAFSSPVVYSPGKLQSTSDLFLARFQIYF